MEINVSKSELAGALSALGKLVCRSSPVAMYRSVKINGSDGKHLTFTVCSPEETLEYRIKTETEYDAIFAGIVPFEEFRLSVKNSKNKTLLLEQNNGTIKIDGKVMSYASCEWQDTAEVSKESALVTLPPNFVGMLAEAAPIVDRTNYRKVLQGINLSRDGITVTNGKELLNIPVMLEMDSLTLPFPLALLATKCTEGGSLLYWHKNEKPYFRMELGSWTWTGKAMESVYPSWKQIIPQERYLNRIVKLNEATIEQLASFLKNVPDTGVTNPVTLSQKESNLCIEADNGMKNTIAAEFPITWEDFSITINKKILLRLLSEHHTTIKFSDDHAPFTATGGLGTFIAMPLYASKKTDVQPQTNKEETKMNEVKNNVVTAVVPSVAVNSNPEPSNPLDDLNVAIDEFKLKLKSIFDESNVLSRKVKEVAIAQKQKERDFIQAKRAIERIRMAI